MAEVMEDADFYGDDGGVTFSGGEAMLQADAVRKISEKLRGKGISVYIDTAGDVPWENFEKVLPFADGYLYDIKTADPEKMTSVIVGDLGRVTDNLSRLISAGADVRIRIPLIPGFNADASDIEAICKLLTDAGAKNVDILPFHRLGSEKYLAMGRDYPMGDTKSPTKAEVSAAAEILRRHFCVTVEG